MKTNKKFLGMEEEAHSSRSELNSSILLRVTFVTLSEVIYVVVVNAFLSANSQNIQRDLIKPAPYCSEKLMS